MRRANYNSYDFYSRGFQITSLQIDGGAPLALGAYTYDASQDLAFYDRVEVMRGASGLLGGMGDPGGIVNLVPVSYTHLDVYKRQEPMHWWWWAPPGNRRRSPWKSMRS